VKRIILVLFVCMIAVFSASAQTYSGDSLQLEPLIPLTTYEDDTSEVKPVFKAKKTISNSDLRRARGLRAGGITMICTAGAGVPWAGILILFGAIYEDGFMFLGPSALGGCAGLTIGGIKMIKAGNRIDGDLSLVPTYNPETGAVGTQLAIHF